MKKDMKFLGLAFLLFITGCNEKQKSAINIDKEVERVIPKKTPISEVPLMSFYAKNGADTIIETLNGTKIIIHDDSFNCKSSIVTVEIIDLYDVSEYMKYGLNTVTIDSVILKSGGVVMINFKDSLGNEILLSDSGVDLDFKNLEKETDMFLYKGVVNNDKFNNWEFYKYYKKYTVYPFPEKAHYDSLNNIFRQEKIFNIVSGGVYNLDVPLLANNEETKDFSVNINDTENCEIYMIFEGEKTLVPYSSKNKNTFLFKGTPLNKNIMLLVVSSSDDSKLLVAKKLVNTDLDEIEIKDFSVMSNNDLKLLIDEFTNYPS